MNILGLWLGKPISFFAHEDPDGGKELLEKHGINYHWLGYTAEGESAVTVSSKDYNEAARLINDYYSGKKTGE